MGMLPNLNLGASGEKKEGDAWKWGRGKQRRTAREQEGQGTKIKSTGGGGRGKKDWHAKAAERKVRREGKGRKRRLRKRRGGWIVHLRDAIHELYNLWAADRDRQHPIRDSSLHHPLRRGPQRLGERCPPPNVLPLQI